MFNQTHAWRHTMMLTTTSGDDIASLDLRRHQQARIED